METRGFPTKDATEGVDVTIGLTRDEELLLHESVITKGRIRNK